MPLHLSLNLWYRLDLSLGRSLIVGVSRPERGVVLPDLTLEVSSLMGRSKNEEGCFCSSPLLSWIWIAVGGGEGR